MGEELVAKIGRNMLRRYKNKGCKRDATGRASARRRQVKKMQVRHGSGERTFAPFEIVADASFDLDAPFGGRFA